MEREWFTLWPLQTKEVNDSMNLSSDNEIATTKRRLKEWFNNNSQVTKKGAAQEKFIDALFPKKDKPTRQLRAPELWAKTNYKEKVKPIVDAKVAELGIPAHRAMGIINDSIRTMFEAEPEEVRQNVYADLAELNSVKPNTATQQGERSPQEYAAYVTFQSMFRSLMGILSAQSKAFQMPSSSSVTLFKLTWGLLSQSCVEVLSRQMEERYVL
ncbi:hypothetical protein C0992_009432 [Termitomyces sp. T32_za158]|nr:hypothetical protein C0992_009432 [Termitomyces sp. T32_za158]